MQVEQKDPRDEMVTKLWLAQLRLLIFGDLPADLAVAGLVLQERSRAFAVPDDDLAMENVLAVAPPKAALRLLAPTTRKQQRYQQAILDTNFEKPMHVVQVRSSLALKGISSHCTACTQ